jgi:hypothetical protein
MSSLNNSCLVSCDGVWPLKESELAWNVEFARKVSGFFGEYISLSHFWNADDPLSLKFLGLRFSLFLISSVVNYLIVFMDVVC